MGAHVSAINESTTLVGAAGSRPRIRTTTSPFKTAAWPLPSRQWYRCADDWRRVGDQILDLRNQPSSAISMDA